MRTTRLWPMLLALLLLSPSLALSQTVPINGNLVVAGHTNACLATGATNTYACSLDFPITAYVTRACYNFTANAANTAAATLNLNSIGAKTIKKVQGGITTDLVADDIRTGQVVQVCYDGTNLQMVSPLGNAPSGSSGITTDTAQRAAFYLTTTTVDGAPGLTFAADGTTVTSYADRITTLSTSATLGVNDGPTVACDATAGTVTATLPDGTTTAQRRFTLVKIDASANTCIIAPNATGTDTINGIAGTATLTARWDRYDVALLSTATAANWTGAYGIAGPLSVAQGGTGATSFTGLLNGNGTAPMSAITSSTVGQVLRVTSANTFAFGALDLADTDAITGMLPVGNGGTNLTGATDDALMVGNGTTWQSKVLPDCTDTGGNHLNYASATNTLTCGTSGTGGSTGISGATNQGAMYATAATTATSTGAMTNGQVLMGTTGSAPSNKALTVTSAKTTTYAVTVADFAAYTTFTVASGTFTITLPINTGQPSAGTYIRVLNYGTGVVTIARNGQNLNGGTASLILPASTATDPSAAFLVSDGTNYFGSVEDGTVAISKVTGGTQLVASGTSAMGTSAIASGACATVVAATATGTATTDVITFTPNADITAVTGYAPVTTGGLAIYVYPTANNFNAKVCNPTSASITPGAISLNWKVIQ